MERLTDQSASLITCLILLALFGINPLAQAQENGTAGQKEQPSSWIKVAPEGAGFSALMPGSPTEKPGEINYAPFKVPTRLYVVKKGDAHFFAGRFGDFPRQLVEAGHVNALFEHAHRVFFESKAKDGTTDTLPFTRRDITHDGHAGREYVSECGPHKKVDGPCMTITRVFKVGDSIFLIGVAGPKSVLTEAHVNRFFSSFALNQ